MLTKKAPRGTRDILPGEVENWRYLENLARELCRMYNYAEIRTPIFEYTELFQHGVGEDTDIVSKEMYTFQDKGGRQLTLRPENTAAVVRAYLENRLDAAPQPIKLYYIGPMFRYDRPGAGRYRQFHQFGVEAFGSKEPSLDAEIIYLAYEFYHRLGIGGLELEINSIGCSTCRPPYRIKLKNHFKTYLNSLCVDCQKRFEQNPLRILDCKEENCRRTFTGVPALKDNLCQECDTHFTLLQQELTVLALPFTINSFMVRGLDYYTKTVFEFNSPHLGAQNSLGGGGRYDDLVETCGGQPTPGIGFAIGLERVLLALEEEGRGYEINHMEVYLAQIGEKNLPLAGKILRDLRNAGISCDRDYLGRSLKAQLRQANRLSVTLTLFLGGEELKDDKVTLKIMSSGEQELVSLDVLVEKAKEILKGEV